LIIAKIYHALYNRERIQELRNPYKIGEEYSICMEEILITYCDCGSMKKTAIIHGISAQKVRKILITLNAFKSDQRRVVKKLVD